MKTLAILLLLVTTAHADCVTDVIGTRDIKTAAAQQVEDGCRQFNDRSYSASLQCSIDYEKAKAQIDRDHDDAIAECNRERAHAEARAMCEARADLKLDRAMIVCGEGFKRLSCTAANVFGPNRETLWQWSRANAECEQRAERR